MTGLDISTFVCSPDFQNYGVFFRSAFIGPLSSGICRALNHIYLDQFLEHSWLDHLTFIETSCHLIKINDRSAMKGHTALLTPSPLGWVKLSWHKNIVLGFKHISWSTLSILPSWKHYIPDDLIDLTTSGYGFGDISWWHLGATN